MNDTQVVYTGPPISSLNICTGDTLAEVDAVILNQLLNFAQGKGIYVENIDLTTCDIFKDCIVNCTSCTDLPCLLNCYKNAICTLYNDYTLLETQINTLLNGPYDTSCLKNNLPTNPTLNQIIQELIKEFCSLLSAFNVLSTSVSGFTSGINTTIGNFLSSAIVCRQNGTNLSGPNITKSGSGSTLQLSFLGFAPIGSVIPFAGSAANFDSTGKGMIDTDAWGWALCNGNNGTVNMSGLFPVGTGMGPAVITGMVLPYNTTGGEYGVTLTSTTIPSVSIGGTITDPGHSHPLAFKLEGSVPQGGAGSSWIVNPIGADYTTPYTDYTGTYHAPTGTIPSAAAGIQANIGVQKTGISLAGAHTNGGGMPHNNMPPYRALYYIQRIF
jgi:hypothetical protein